MTTETTRTCADCHADISHRGRLANYCIGCSRRHTREREQARDQAFRERIRAERQAIRTGIAVQIPAHAWEGGLVVKTQDDWLL